MPGYARNRLSFTALMQASGCDTARELGHELGLSRAAVQRLKSTGVTIHRGDEFATKLGLHGAEVWGDAFYTTTELVDGELDSGLLF